MIRMMTLQCNLMERKEERKIIRIALAYITRTQVGITKGRGALVQGLLSDSCVKLGACCPGHIYGGVSVFGFSILLC
jgi:hypothetical protein